MADRIDSAQEGARAARPRDGRLVVVPTPLGNLGDMTERALAALRDADTVCAEDTRVTGKLLAAFGIKKRLQRLDEALVAQRAAGVVERVMGGEVIAYCSDAGMPGVSDPGMRLVRACPRGGGCRSRCCPGPTAVATAYVASGCDNQRFYFGGFFPRKAGERRAVLESLRSLGAALIFYESPNRLDGALEAIAETFPLREATVCRELTKLHEEIVRAATPELRDEFARRAAQGGIKGEIVIVVRRPHRSRGRGSGTACRSRRAGTCGAACRGGSACQAGGAHACRRAGNPCATRPTRSPWRRAVRDRARACRRTLRRRSP